MFDEYRINRLLKNDITVEMYNKLPTKIKDDPRIIEKFVADDPRNINYISTDHIVEMITHDYELCEHLEGEILNEVFSELDLTKIEITSDMFSELDPKNKYILSQTLPETYFDLLPEEELPIEFSEMIAQISTYKNAYFEGMDLEANQERAKEVLFSLSADKISLIAEEGTLNTQNFVTQEIQSLSKEEQMELYHSDESLYDYLSPDIQEDVLIENCENDICKILELPDPVQIKYFSNHVEQLKFASRDIMGQIFEMGNISLTFEQFREITFDKGYKIGSYADEMFQIMPQEEILKFLNGGCVNSSEFLHYLRTNEDCISNIRKLIELQASKLDDMGKQEELVGVFSSLIRSRNDLSFGGGVKGQICGMLFDDAIIKSVDPALLLKYAETEDKNVYIDILSTAYGEHVREIFNERPMLSHNEIPTFKIFSKEVIDGLGLEFVNYMLTYNYDRFTCELNSIAMDPEQMGAFKNFWDYTMNRCEKVDSNTIYGIMNNFASHKSFVSQLDFEHMTEHQKEMLDLYLVEADDTKHLVHTIEDLDNYSAIRTEFFKNAVAESDSISDKQNMIFEFMTGRSVNQDSGTIEQMGISDVVSVFNVNNIVRNPQLVEDMNLTSDEVALLLLINQVKGIYNEQVLDEVFLAVANSDELNPINFQSTFDKISGYYMEKFKSELTDSAALEQMPETMVDGIPVVSFEGEPFNVLCSVTDANLSMRIYSKVERGDTILSDWLNLENGMSNISCGLCSSDVCINPMGIIEYDAKITFVFDSDVDIIAMGGSDIASSHTKRDPRHGFEYIGHNKMKFASMDEMKHDTIENMREMKQTKFEKFPNEVSVRRREEDIRTVEQSQKRTMPIGIYVMGDISEEVLQTAKMFSEYYKKNNLGEFRIIKVNPEKYPTTSIYDYVQTPKEKIESNVSWYQETQEIIGRGK